MGYYQKAPRRNRKLEKDYERRAELPPLEQYKLLLAGAWRLAGQSQTMRTGQTEAIAYKLLADLLDIKTLQQEYFKTSSIADKTKAKEQILELVRLSQEQPAQQAQKQA